MRESRIIYEYIALKYHDTLQNDSIYFRVIGVDKRGANLWAEPLNVGFAPSVWAELLNFGCFCIIPMHDKNVRMKLHHLGARSL